MKYYAISPDGFGVECKADYKTKKEAQKAIEAFCERYKVQGFYSTIQNGERVRIPYKEIKNYCYIKKI